MADGVEYPHRWPCTVCRSYFRIKKDGTPTKHISRAFRDTGPCRGCTIPVKPLTPAASCGATATEGDPQP